MENMLSQILVQTGKQRDSTLALAHNMDQMRNAQVGSTGMLMEVYRNQVKPGCQVQLPAASSVTVADRIQQAALPKAAR